MTWRDLVFTDNAPCHIRRHTIFWSVFIVYFYLQSLSPWCTKGLDPSNVFYFALVSTVCFVPSCVVSVYTFIYLLYPRYILQTKFLPLFLSSLVLFLSIVLMNYLLSHLFFYFSTAIPLAQIPAHRIFAMGFINSLNAMLAGAFVCSFRITRYLYWHRREQQKLLELALKTNSQMIRSTLRPVFLKSRLAAIHHHASLNAAETAPLILDFSGFLSYILYDAKKEIVPLVEELQALQKMLFPREVKWSIQGQPSGKTIHPMQLVNILCDYLEHIAAPNDLHALHVSICIRIKNEQLLMAIEGSSKSVVSRKKGLSNKPASHYHLWMRNSGGKIKWLWGCRLETKREKITPQPVSYAIE